MKIHEAFDVINRHYSDQLVVVSLGTATKTWHRLHGPENDQSFHMHSMGMACSFGLGLALAQPQAPVWVFDGDGALIMSLGSLLTMAHQQPPNLTYFLISNRSYRIIDGPRLVNADRTDYVALARGAGIEQAYSFSELSALKQEIGGVLAAPGFKFISLELEPVRTGQVKVPYEGPEIKYRFARYVERRTGAKVLGPSGY